MLLSSPIVVLIRYWVLQGWLCMNRVERIHRALLELVVFAAILWLLLPHASPVTAVLVSLVLTHTLSAIFNGHPWAVLVHDAGVHGVCYYGDRQKFMTYVGQMQARLQKQQPDYVEGAVIFGSIVRGVFRETSDLDIRYIAKPGFWNAFRTAQLVFIERLRATLGGFPMDIYMYLDADEAERKMKVSSEPPVIVYPPDGGLFRVWDHARTMQQMSEALEANKDIPPEVKPPRVVIVSSGGGHLTEVLLAVEGIPLRTTIATIRLPHTESLLESMEVNRYYLVDPHNRFFKYIKNIWQSFWLIAKNRPDYVISTGAGMAVWTCLIGKLLGSKLIFIETAARVITPSRTGKLMYRLADLFIIQWPQLKEIYPKARVGGLLL